MELHLRRTLPRDIECMAVTVTLDHVERAVARHPPRRPAPELIRVGHGTGGPSTGEPLSIPRRLLLVAARRACDGGAPRTLPTLGDEKLPSSCKLGMAIARVHHLYSRTISASDMRTKLNDC